MGAALLATSAAPTIHVPHIDYLSILPMLIMLGGALLLHAGVVTAAQDPGRPGRHGHRRRRVDGRPGGRPVPAEHVAAHGASVTIAGAVYSTGSTSSSRS